MEDMEDDTRVCVKELCYRCARNAPTMRLRAYIGCYDAVCDCVRELPAYLPAIIRERYFAGNHAGAVSLGMQYAPALGLDGEELYRMPTTDAAVKVLKAVAAVEARSEVRS